MGPGSPCIVDLDLNNIMLQTYSEGDYYYYVACIIIAYYYAFISITHFTEFHDVQICATKNAVWLSSKPRSWSWSSLFQSLGLGHASQGLGLGLASQGLDNKPRI